MGIQMITMTKVCPPYSIVFSSVKGSGSDIAHMRRVVSYCKRHLAQEQTAKLNPNSKSYKSLKNWGHDALKA